MLEQLCIHYLYLSSDTVSTTHKKILFIFYLNQYLHWLNLIPSSIFILYRIEKKMLRGKRCSFKVLKKTAWTYFFLDLQECEQYKHDPPQKNPSTTTSGAKPSSHYTAYPCRHSSEIYEATRGRKKSLKVYCAKRREHVAAFCSHLCLWQKEMAALRTTATSA